MASPPVNARLAALSKENADLRSQLADAQTELDQVRQSEWRYRQIFENSPISIMLWNRDGYLTEINTAAEDFYGLPIAQFNQQLAPIFDNPQLAENGTLPYMQRALAGEAVVEPATYYDSSRNSEGGSFVNGRGHYAPIRNAAGVVEELVEICPDYSDYFALQTQLLEAQERAAQERARLLSTVAQVANLLLRSPDYTTVLPDVVRLLGEAVGSDRCGIGQNMTHPVLDKPAVRIKSDWEWCAAGVPHSEEFSAHTERLFLWEEDAPNIHTRLLHGDVVNCLVDDLLEPERSLLIAQGNTAELFVPILIDDQLWGFIAFDNCGEPRLYDESEIAILQVAADSIAAAIERQVKDEGLRESEHRYRTLFELSNEGIYRFEFVPPGSTANSVEENVKLLYQNFRYAEVNDAFVKQYGFESADQIVGKGPVEFWTQDSDLGDESHRQIIENGYRLRNAASEEIDAHGKRRFFLWNVICDVEDGWITGGWGTQTDITELKQTQQALLAAEQDRTQCLQTIATLANQLLRSNDYTTVLPDVVRLLGEAVGSDRCAIVTSQIFPVMPDSPIYVAAEWCNQNVLKAHKHVPEIYLTTWRNFPELYERLFQGEIANYLVTDFSEPNRYLLEAQDVSSVVYLPITVNGQPWGQIGFDNCGEPRLYDEAEIAILKVAADSIAAAIERDRTQQEREQSIQQRAAELAEHNRVLQGRDLILAATAEASKILLTAQDFDMAINAALRILGESVGCDRICVGQQFDDPDAETRGFIRFLYEWDAPGVTSQLNDHEDMTEFNWDEMGLGDWLNASLNREAIGRTIDELPNPFRQGQRELGVQSIHNVPIFVEGQFWGVFGIDHCHEKKLLADAELTVFKTAANCIGSAIQRDRIQKEREQAAQQRAAELEEHNRVLQGRDRILEATATAVNALLTTETLDEAVNAALRIIGESLDTDRIGLIEIESFDETSNLSLVGWQCLYEWHSSHTVSQLLHPEYSRGNHEGIEAWLNHWVSGQSISCLLEEMPEPFRSAMAAIGLAAFHSVPIFVEGQYWGNLGIDDCHETKRRDLAELAVLKTAAACIGSAIQRDRTQKAILQAEQARTQELERLNTELQQTLDRLSESEERFRTLFELSSEGFYYVELDPPCPTTLPYEEQCDWLYQNFRVVKANPAFAAMYGVDDPDALIGLSNADVHIAGSEKNAAFITAIVKNGYRGHNLETEEIDTQGRLRYFLNSGVCTISEGYIVGAWATQVDITDLRQAQTALLEAEQARAQELEHLNAELQHTLERLSESEERYRTLFEISSEGIYRFELEQPISLALPIDKQVEQYYQHFYVSEGNQTYAKMYGFEEAESVAGLRLRDVHISDSEQNRSFIRALMESGHQIQNYDSEERDRYGNPRYFLNNITTIIKDGYAIGGWASQLDITELRLAQQALLTAEQNRVAELAKANTVLKRGLKQFTETGDLNTFLGYVLQEIAQQTGACAGHIFVYHANADTFELCRGILNGEIYSRALSDDPAFFRAPFATDLVKLLPQLRESRTLICQPFDALDAAQIPHEIRQWSDQHQYPQFALAALMAGDQLVGLFDLAFDQLVSLKPETLELINVLTDQASLVLHLTQLAEDRRRAAIIQERNYTAREIHDTLAQDFGGILIQLQAVERFAKTHPDKAQTRLHRARDLARKGLAEARSSIWVLSQEGEAYSNLATVLAQLADQMTVSTDIQTSITVIGTPYLLSPEQGMHLLRIAQEACNNALRHAQAQTLQIHLSYIEQLLELRIVDDGLGFDPQHLSQGFGLKGMQQRADSIGASLTVSSQLNQGTEVHVMIPIE